MDPFRRYSRSKYEVVWNWHKFCMFWDPNLFEGGLPNFWTCIIKRTQIAIMWQSFTAIGWGSSEISWQWRKRANFFSLDNLRGKVSKFGKLYMHLTAKCLVMPKCVIFVVMWLSFGPFLLRHRALFCNYWLLLLWCTFQPMVALINDLLTYLLSLAAYSLFTSPITV